MQLHITKIYRSDKNKEGQPFKTKDGRPYTRCAIQCSEYGIKWLSGFGNQANSTWQEGYIVDLTVEEKGEYLNFSMPKAEDLLKKEIDDLKLRVGKLEEFNRPPLEGKDSALGNIPQQEIPTDEIPF